MLTLYFVSRWDGFNEDQLEKFLKLLSFNE